VLPYNYPRLWPLLDELINTHRNMPNHKWRKVRYMSPPAVTCIFYVSNFFFLVTCI
jgi:hypothetical protein